MPMNGECRYRQIQAMIMRKQADALPSRIYHSNHSNRPPNCLGQTMFSSLMKCEKKNEIACPHQVRVKRAYGGLIGPKPNLHRLTRPPKGWRANGAHRRLMVGL